jgi:hypothetical protein
MRLASAAYDRVAMCYGELTYTVNLKSALETPVV